MAPSLTPSVRRRHKRMTFGAAISTWPMNAARDVVVSGQLR
jgi:hypothetical protein